MNNLSQNTSYELYSIYGGFHGLSPANRLFDFQMAARENNPKRSHIISKSLPGLQNYDEVEVLKSSLQSIFNLHLTEKAWIESSLPI